MEENPMATIAMVRAFLDLKLLNAPTTAEEVPRFSSCASCLTNPCGGVTLSA
jgi:hypothetical protein